MKHINALVAVAALAIAFTNTTAFAALGKGKAKGKGAGPELRLSPKPESARKGGPLTEKELGQVRKAKRAIEEKLKEGSAKARLAEVMEKLTGDEAQRLQESAKIIVDSSGGASAHNDRIVLLLGEMLASEAVKAEDVSLSRMAIITEDLKGDNQAQEMQTKIFARTAEIIKAVEAKGGEITLKDAHLTAFRAEYLEKFRNELSGGKYKELVGEEKKRIDRLAAEAAKEEVSKKEKEITDCGPAV